MKHSVSATGGGATTAVIPASLGDASDVREIVQIYASGSATGTVIFKNTAGAEVFRLSILSTFDGVLQILPAGGLPWFELPADNKLDVTNNTAAAVYLHVYSRIRG